MTAIPRFAYQYLFNKYFRTPVSIPGSKQPRLKISLTASFLLLLLVAASASAQEVMDTAKNNRKWNFHYQSTLITQYHPAFQANYPGRNSLNSNPESSTSVSGTLFFGAKLWKGAEAYFNPELTGGSGFSQTTGIAGFPNGETYRVGDPAPHVYVARLFVSQRFPLSGKYEYREDGPNQIGSKVPTSYLAISAGKFSVMDFLDNNKYSHHPHFVYLPHHL